MIRAGADALLSALSDRVPPDWALAPLIAEDMFLAMVTRGNFSPKVPELLINLRNLRVRVFYLACACEAAGLTQPLAC
jgi:hypothetical protein